MDGKTEKEMSMKITFGKFIGYDTSEVPESYLVWCCENLIGVQHFPLIKEACRLLKTEWPPDRMKDKVAELEKNEEQSKTGFRRTLKKGTELRVVPEKAELPGAEAKAVVEPKVEYKGPAPLTPKEKEPLAPGPTHKKVLPTMHNYVAKFHEGAWAVMSNGKRVFPTSSETQAKLMADFANMIHTEAVFNAVEETLKTLRKRLVTNG